MAVRQGRRTLRAVTNPMTVNAWRQASMAWANSARGNVELYLGPSPSEKSIWNQLELPALKANPAVTSITVLDRTTGQRTVLFSR